MDDRRSKRVAFIGLGVMGRPMAKHLLEAGCELVVSSRSPGPVSELEDLGACGARTPAEAARNADVVITMLPDSPDVAEVLTGDNGVFRVAAPGTLVIDMSTISPAAARELATAGKARGLAVLDAPVSGGDAGARAGTLSVMVGGEEADFEHARPVLETMASTVTYVGGPGCGQIVKACNQIVVALTIEGLSEALTLGTAAGVNPEKILDVLGAGLASNRFMEVRRRNLLEHDFTPGFRVDLHHKDLAIALGAARDLGVELPATPIVSRLLQALSERGRGGEDHSALLAAVEELSARR